MGTRALVGVKKDGKYYMTSRKLDGGYGVAGAEILKSYINNSKEDFEKAFSLMAFKDVPNYGDTVEGAIKESLFYRKYNAAFHNFISLINTKDVKVASEKETPEQKMRYKINELFSKEENKIENEILMYDFHGKPRFIKYDKVKDYDLEDKAVEGKLNLINFNIFKNDCYASYVYVYDFENDALECYAAKGYKNYENKDNKKELLIEDKEAGFRFVNTFTFTRNSKLRKYAELFDGWYFIEQIYEILNPEGSYCDIEDVVDDNIDKYLDALSNMVVE